MPQDTVQGELYMILKDMKFSDIMRIQESPTDIYQTRLRKLGIDEEDWVHFIDVINELARTESAVSQPSKNETVDGYIMRVAQHQAASEEQKQ
jgi:hypothetical protein